MDTIQWDRLEDVGERLGLLKRRLLVNTHAFTEEQRDFTRIFSKAILLVREPFEAIKVFFGPHKGWRTTQMEFSFLSLFFFHRQISSFPTVM